MTMKTTFAGALALALVVGGAGTACKEKAKKPKRSAQDDKELAELKQGGDSLQVTSEDLLKRRGKLQTGRMAIKEAWKRLEAKRAGLAKDDVAGHQAVAKEEAELRAKENKLRRQEEEANKKLMTALADQRKYLHKATAALAKGSGGGGDGTAAVRGREMSLAGREKYMARREKDLAERERKLNEAFRKVLTDKAKKCAVATTVYTTIAAPVLPTGPLPTGGGAVTKKDAKSAFGRALGTKSSKGIRSSDVPGLGKMIGDIRKSLKTKQWARAKVMADGLRSQLKGIRIDRSFVGAKMGRLSRVIRKKKLTEDKRGKVNKLFVGVTNAYNDGSFKSANRKINKIYGVIR